MKRILVLALAAYSINSYSADDGAGCGFGAAVFDGQSGLAPHVLAATTNGFIGNQTFGMSTGTLGCDATGTIDSVAGVYLDNNIDRVAFDFANGEGESLEAMIELINIDAQHQMAFKSLVQDKFSQIFTNEQVTSKQVMHNLNQLLSEHNDLHIYAS